MKLRILSDLHLDINRRYPLELDNNYDYTLIAGDLGGDYRKNTEWIKKNIHQGAFISGNHDAYTMDNTPLEDVKEYYHKNFPLDSEITYFDDDVGVISKEIGDNILLVADVLYTDYKLRIYKDDSKIPLKKVIEKNKFRAYPKLSGPYMNDFTFYTRKGTYEKNNYDQSQKDIFFLRPENYRLHFNSSFKKIKRIVEDNPDKDIVLMTHHCLSKRCLSERYVVDVLNASYVSNKESWIRKHPQIKLVVSGHVHNRSNFKIGNTLYVLNPLGYCREGQHEYWNEKTKKYDFWTPNFFVDTDNWSIISEDYRNELCGGQENENFLKYSKYAGLFI